MTLNPGGGGVVRDYMYSPECNHMYSQQFVLDNPS